MKRIFFITTTIITIIAVSMTSLARTIQTRYKDSYNWQQDSVGWYVADNLGGFTDGFLNVGTPQNVQATYFIRDGYMVANQWIGDKNGFWYYAGSDGAILKNTTTPDGYAVDQNGVCLDASGNRSISEDAKIDAESGPNNAKNNCIFGINQSSVSSSTEQQNNDSSNEKLFSTDETYAAALVARLNEKYHVTNIGSMHAANVTYRGNTYKCVTVSYKAITVLGAESDYRDAAILYDKNGDIIKMTYYLENEDGWPYDLQLQILKLYADNIGVIDRQRVQDYIALYSLLK